jgi:SAM-dependent methyltransferase
MSTNKESFQPITNDPPIDFISKIKFSLRLLLDFQTLTLYKNLRKFLRSKRGKLLDIGCGNSPYKHLLNKDCEYIGIDIKNQSDFNYNNDNILHFNGSDIPMDNESIDSFICTEVLEHIIDPKKLITEMKRVLKKDGVGLISIPWSARNHYIPYDFHRYTPAALSILFKDFKGVQIEPRGSEITTICSKIIVLIMGAYRSCIGLKSIFIPILTLVAIPMTLFCVIIGHLSIIFNLGSKDDPLGYTIFLSK